MEAGRRGIAIYIAVAFGLAYLIDYTLAIPLLANTTPGREASLIAALVLRMLTPTIGALAALYIEGRLRGLRESLAELGLRDPGPRWILAGAGLAALGLALSLLLSPLLGLRLGRCGDLAMIPLPLVVMFAVLGLLAGATVNALVALGEELGWRGYLHEVLMERSGSVVITGLAVGLVWGLWHAPIIYEGYNYSLSPSCGPGARGLIPVALFTLVTMTLGVVMAWLREASRTAVASAAMHGTINALGGLAAGLVVGPRLLAPPAGLAGIAGFALVAALVLLAGRKR